MTASPELAATLQRLDSTLQRVDLITQAMEDVVHAIRVQRMGSGQPGQHHKGVGVDWSEAS